jgi:hypothetical protein
MLTNSSLCCHWCGVLLGNASRVTYLNGNLPVCDLCLIKAGNVKPAELCWCGGDHTLDKHPTVIIKATTNY